MGKPAQLNSFTPTRLSPLRGLASRFVSNQFGDGTSVLKMCELRDTTITTTTTDFAV